MRFTDEQQRVISFLGEENVNSLEETMAWQQRLRDAVNEIVVAKLQPVFNVEFKKRFGDTGETKRQACSWANRVLFEAGLCLSMNGQACSFHATRGRESDHGRVYLESFSTAENPRRKLERFKPGNEVFLRALPIRSHNLSKAPGNRQNHP